MSQRIKISLLSLLLCTTLPAYASWTDSLDKFLHPDQEDSQAAPDSTVAPNTATTADSSLSENTVISGLKEALTIAAQRAVENLSQPEGFENDAATRISMPAPLDKLEPALRKAGIGSQIDSFKQDLNKSAEQAVPQATSILTDTIKNMTFEDAKAIYSGSDHAATEYLQQKAGPKLAELFKPVISSKLADNTAYKGYQAVATQAAKLPVIGQHVDTDLSDYVTQKALDGLFMKLGNEEAAIRENPTARTTDLLKKLWGNH